GTAGAFTPSIVTSVTRESLARPASTRPTRTVIETGYRPTSNRGIWIPYNGAQWDAAGAAVQFDRDKFMPVGEYHGFPVYRAKDGRRDEIFITTVDGGLLTPYAQH